MQSAPLTCTYHGAKGICGRTAWRERCSYHQKTLREYFPCATCQAPTRSKYGLCRKHHGAAKARARRNRIKSRQSAADSIGAGAAPSAPSLAQGPKAPSESPAAPLAQEPFSATTLAGEPLEDAYIDELINAAA
jgi:hypothetical protein